MKRFHGSCCHSNVHDASNSNVHDASNGPDDDLYDPNVIHDGNGGTEVNDSGQHLQCPKTEQQRVSIENCHTHTTAGDGTKLKTAKVVYACRIVLQSVFNFQLLPSS